jgi:pyrophosphatase PpaX
MPQHPPLQALLFDLDGTLIDTHDLIWRCYSRVLEERVGEYPNREWFTRATGLPLDEIFAAALAGCGREDVDVDALVSRYRELQLELDHSIRVFPGVEPLLDDLARRGLRLAIVTTKHSRLALRHIRMLGLEERFETVVTGDQCARSKPDPEPFRTALERLGLPPDSALGVGDSIHDIASARAAGLQTAAACWGALDRAALVAANPDVVLESPGELLDRLG